MNFTLPTLQKDMTFFSWMSAAHMMNGSLSGYQLSEHLLSNGSAGTRIDFPSHLAHFCKTTSCAIGDPFSIALNLTILPYFLSFRPENVLNKSVRLMEGNSVENLRLTLGIQPAHAYQTAELKFCITCVENDIDKLGYAYWHRSHQLPTSHTCPIHHEILETFKFREMGQNSSQFSLPPKHRFLKDNQQKSNHTLHRLSMLSNDVLNHLPATPFHSEQLQRTYEHGLRQQGLLTNRSRVKAQRFLEQLNLYFSSIRTHQAYTNVLAQNNLSHFLKLVRKPRGFHHPVSHLLLIEFLFGSWELFKSTYQWQGQFQLELDLIDPTETYQNSIDNELFEIIERYEDGCSLKTLAKQYGYDPGTLMRTIDKTGLIKTNKRPKLVSISITTEVICLLQSGLPLKEIASKTGLSKATIDRICCAYPEVHRAWQIAKKNYRTKQKRDLVKQFANTHINLSRGDFKKHLPSTMAWLSKHDHQWLDLFMHDFPIAQSKRAVPMKRRPRVDWGMRDELCLAALKKVDLDDIESWERTKPPLFLRRLPALPFKPNLIKLPKSKEWIDSELKALHAIR